VGDVPFDENLIAACHSLYPRGSSQHQLSDSSFHPAFDCNVILTR